MVSLSTSGSYLEHGHPSVSNPCPPPHDAAGAGACRAHYPAQGPLQNFGSQVVLNGLDLDIEPAKTTVIMGPSGCGKSVTLKHIVGLIHPDAGEIYFDGRRIDNLPEEALPPIRLQIGLLFQSGALFDSMTVEENIAFPLVEHTKLLRPQHDAVIEALKTVDLEGVEDKLPAQLSGGQPQPSPSPAPSSSAPAWSSTTSPPPAWTPSRADGINDLIIKLKETMGVTNVVVTHDISSAQKVGDRIVMLLGGKVAADGPYDALTRCPDVRVQHFLMGKYDPADVASYEPPQTDAVDTLGARDIGI